MKMIRLIRRSFKYLEKIFEILMLLKIMPEVFLIPITEKNTNRFINDIRRAIEVEIEGIMNIWN